MNHLKAYRGIAAAYRALNRKWTRHLQTHNALQAKYNVLASEDPVLADLIDANHGLITKSRKLGEELAESKRTQSQLFRDNNALRTKAQDLYENLVTQRKYTSFWAFACLTQALSTGVYLAFSLVP